MRGFIVLQTVLAFLAHAPAWARQPNVVLILTDDQGYGDLGCHGNRVIRTPNLDRLHARSVRMADFHVSPVCSPTRAALMTGRYPNRVGVWHVVMSRSLLRPGEITVADLFSAGGYRTAIFGKWHLGDNYPYRPQDRGFQEVLVHGGGVVGHVPDFWLNDYFDDTYLHNVKWRRCAVMTDRWRLVDGKLLYDVKTDPGQKHDVAAEQPEVVARLRAAYERWWSDVSQRHGETTEIPIGSDKQNPVRLTCYHWNNATGNQRDMPWGQAHIVAGLHHHGYWPVRVDRAGTCRFTLRRWPREAALAINETSHADPPEKPSYLRPAAPLIATRARLKIEEFDATLPVEADVTEVTFTAQLRPGSARLQTWLSDEQGEARGAYYVWVERLVDVENRRGD